MRHATTSRAAVDAATDLFFPVLESTEDFDSLEEHAYDSARGIAAVSVAASIERFDARLRECPPIGWRAHERAARTIVTLVGAVTYARTVYLDQYGRRRAWADELLGIPPRARYSVNAFRWIVRRAAEVSYRKAARDFLELTGEAVSQVTVMRCVHEEGRLLKEAGAAGDGVSNPDVFVEVDGLWIRLQDPAHREQALPRGVYEQAREAKSFELKMACVYAGKSRDAHGRTRRLRLSVVAGDDGPDEFWRRVWDQVGATFCVEDAETVHLGADGGSWCGPERLGLLAPEGVVVEHSLDPFHVMQAICRAYPEGPKRDWAQSLAFRRKPGQLVRMCERVSKKMPAGKQRDKVRELGRYISNNMASIRFPRPSMGTMEGTNFHVAAVRMKNRGMSWSRRGAEAMALVRAALASGRPLPSPDKGALFTPAELARAEASLPTSASQVPTRVGRGREPMAVHSVTKTCEISLSRRS